MKRNRSDESTRIFRSLSHLTTLTFVGATLACGLALSTTGCTTVGVVRPPAAFNISSATPPHRLPKHEYPFDAEGNYRTDWLDPKKSSNKQVAPSHRTTPTIASTSTPPPSPSSSRSSSPSIFSSSRSSKPSSSSRGGSSSRSSRTTIVSVPSPPPPRPIPEPILEPAPAPKPPPPKPKPKPPQTRYHTIARGETLWAISRRYGKSVDAIKSANGLSSDLIKPGQKLKIP